MNGGNFCDTVLDVLPGAGSRPEGLLCFTDDVGVSGVLFCVRTDSSLVSFLLPFRESCLLSLLRHVVCFALFLARVCCMPLPV